MRLGLSSYTYTWAVGVPGSPPGVPMGAVDIIDKAAALGVGVVQFADNLPLHELAGASVGLLEARARERDIRIEVGTRGIGQHLLAYADLAERFGSPFVRIVIDRGSDRPSPEEAAERLSFFRTVFESRGVKLAIENHDRFSCAELVELVERLGPWAGICLDTVNSFGAMEAPQTVIRALGPYTVNVHLKDFSIRRPQHKMGFEITGTPVGRGLLDVGFLLEHVAEVGHADSAILELWTPPEPSIDATCAKESRWAEESVGYLRRHTSLEFAVSTSGHGKTDPGSSPH